jgi:hypothetical protein
LKRRERQHKGNQGQFQDVIPPTTQILPKSD